MCKYFLFRLSAIVLSVFMQYIGCVISLSLSLSLFFFFFFFFFFSLRISAPISPCWVCFLFFFFNFFLRIWAPISPWYNRTGWLGVKHQLTYLFSSDFITMIVASLPTKSRADKLETGRNVTDTQTGLIRDVTNTDCPAQKGSPFHTLPTHPHPRPHLRVIATIKCRLKQTKNKTKQKTKNKKTRV